MVVAIRRGAVELPSGASKASRSASGRLRRMRQSIVRRGALMGTLGPPITGSSSPLVASMASRISSASSRSTVRFQSSRLAGSIRRATARSCSLRYDAWR